MTLQGRGFAPPLDRSARAVARLEVVVYHVEARRIKTLSRHARNGVGE